MSDQPERDRETSDQADAAADSASSAQPIETPLIRTDIGPAGGRKRRGGTARYSARKAAPAFDAAAINRLVDVPPAEADSPEPESSVVPPDAQAKPTDEPGAQRESPAVETEEPAEETATAACDATAGDMEEDAPGDSGLPVVTASGRAKTRATPQSLTRRAAGSRPGKYRRFRSRTSGWILLGVCGATALLVVVLLVNRGGRPAGGAAAPRGGLRTSSSDDAFPAPGLPEIQRAESSRTGIRPTEIPPNEVLSRTGVRPMNEAEKARLRKQIDSFAEMGRAEEDRLRREKPKTNTPKEPH